MSRSVSRRGRDPARRSAFTLVELLVVVAIIAMLMAMLFPAFGQVIEAVRRNQCQDKLGDLAQTAIVYEQINRSFPKVSTKPVENAQPGSTDKETGGYSWAVFFVPHYDGEEEKYNRLRVASAEGNKAFRRSPWDPELVDELGAVGEATGRHFSTYSFDFFICPSYSSDSVIPNTTEAKEYETVVQDNEGRFAVGTMNYVALSATSMSKVDPSRGSGSSSSSSEDQDSTGKARPDGVIIYRTGPGVRKNEIRDGETTTLMFAETRESRYSAWMDGATAWVVAHDPNVQEPTKSEQGYLIGVKSSLNVGPVIGTKDADVHYLADYGQDPWSWGPSSFHSGGTVNHVAVSGAVRAITTDSAEPMSPTVYLHLVTRNGKDPGEDLSPEAIDELEANAGGGEGGGGGGNN